MVRGGHRASSYQALQAADDLSVLGLPVGLSGGAFAAFSCTESIPGLAVKLHSGRKGEPGSLSNLRTPLATEATPEQAADAVAGLLYVLVIDRVCIMGTSGGGPTALQLALRHPERVWELVFQSAISQRFVEPRRSTHSLIGRVIFSRGKWLADFGAWGAHLVARYWPSLLIRSLLNASDDLERSKANERLSYVLRHPEQIAFFPARGRVWDATQRAGLHNDLHQFASLPVYPLERCGRGPRPWRTSRS